MKLGEILDNDDRQSILDYMIDLGMTEEQAITKLDATMRKEKWRLDGECNFRRRIRKLMKERGAGETVTATEFFSPEELKAICTEEMNAARERSLDLN